MIATHLLRQRRLARQLAAIDDIEQGTLVASADARAWDSLVAGASDGSILQSWSWGELKSRYGWEPTRYLWIRAGKIRGGISVLRKPLIGGFAVYYAPRGPVLDDDFSEFPRLWAALRGELAARGGTVLKLDPEWTVEAAAVLRGSGARPSQAIQHQATSVVDLRGGEAVFGRMTASARRNMRLAEKAGVLVESSTDMEALDRFYELLLRTAERQTFIVRPRSYYRDLLEAFRRQCQVRIYLATQEGVTLAASVIVRYGTRLTYLFSASSDAGRQLKAPYLIQQRVIRDGQEAGAVSYDLWGIPLDPRPGDAGWGYAQFKAMLGGVPRRFVGAWEIPVQRQLAAAYQLAERVAGRRTMVA